MVPITLHIIGMSCSHCLNAVSRALNEVPGSVVKSVQIGRAEVDVTDAAAVEEAVAAVDRAGYSATAVARA